MSRAPNARSLAGALLLALACTNACAEKKALDDDELRGVNGHGIALVVDLKLNTSSVAAGFKNGDTTTYAIVEGFGGELQLFAITIDAVARAGGSDYLAIGMPGYLHAKDFGARAIGVQTDANVPLTSSLGSLLLNGTASMTGQLNLWAK
jgi:hypothetical protein